MAACKNLIFVSCIIFFLSSVEPRLFFTTYFDHQPKSPEPHFRRLSEISLVPSPAPEILPTRASPAPENSLVDPDKTHHRHSPPRVPECSPPPPPPEPIAPAKSPTASPDAQTVFDVMSYGAVGDGVTDDTSAFKMAWDDACHADESGTLLAPNHHTFMIQSTIFTGPCKNSVVFQIEGTVVPPDGPDSWPKSNNRRQWLVFYRINGMVMQGGGMIDGRGEKWWNLPCKPHKGPNGTTLAGPCDSPVTMRFFWSKNLTVQGLRVRNSPQFHFRFDTCQNVHINSLNIKSPALSPNTDGIHLENTTDVRIYNTLVYNGDDCVSIGAGCHNVDIRNITCGPSHGISIGSLGVRNSKACVSNISVTNSVIRHSDNGVRIKTWQGGFGSVSQITFNNIEMDTVRNPIIIDQYYCDTKACKNQTSAVYISDIFYGNIKGTYDVRSPPMKLACSDAVPCTNLTISGVELYPAQGMRFMDAYCWKAYGSLMTVTIPPVFCLREGIPDAFPPNDGINQC